MGGSFNSGRFHGTKGSPQLPLDLGQEPSHVIDWRVGAIAPPPASPSARDILMSEARTDEAKDVVNQLYRPGGKVGDGGTADAIREEIATGKPVGDRNHSRKGRQRIKQIERILRRNPNHPDRELLERMCKDLKDALGGN